MKLNENDFELVVTPEDIEEVTEIETETEPELDASRGIADLLIQSLNNVWEAISRYNSLVATMTEHQFQDMVPVIQDILTDNSNHVGKLQELIELISPELTSIEEGEKEAISTLDDTAITVLESFVDVDRKNKVVNINIKDIYDNYYKAIGLGFKKLQKVSELNTTGIKDLSDATYILNNISAGLKVIRSALSGLEANCHDAFLELKSDYSRKRELRNEDMKIIKEDLSEVTVDDVQAVCTTGFALSQEEHEQFKKEAEDAIKENEKIALDQIPKEGDTGKKVKSPELKKMHLSEDLFSESFQVGDTVAWKIGNNRIGTIVAKTGSDVYKVDFAMTDKLPGRIDYCYEDELTKVDEVEMRECKLTEANIKYDIAKNQLKNYQEGKMKRSDWTPKAYLENLVNKNHLTQDEADELSKEFNVE